MRDLTTTLLGAQQAKSLDPKVKITLARGASTYTYETDRILSIKHEEEPYRQSAEVTLDNSDGALTALDLKGFKAILSWGLVTKAGKEYSDTAPLWVLSPQLGSVPGKLTCELRMVGIPNLLTEDKANAEYIPLQEDAGWEWTIKTLLTKLLGATLACYNHCTPYTIAWGTLDNVINSYKPKDSFRIAINSSRLAHIRRLLDLTKCVMLFKADGKAYIFQPTITGSVYDYQYSLASGHTFFSKASRLTLVTPNRVVVRSNPDDTPFYQGEATDDSYDSLDLKNPTNKTEYKQMTLESNDQAKNIATAILSKHQLWSEMGAAEAPLNCGQEVFDYVKVTDEREKDYRIGNIGTLTRSYKPGQYPMRFGFGGWLSVRKLLDELETNSAPEWDFLSLSVKDLLIERVRAYWLDPEGNIDSSKLTDDFYENLPDGETYFKIKSMNLDATGLALDNYTSYTLRLSGEAAKKVWKGLTPPTIKAIGDLWLDTNYTPNRVKRWSGTQWQELPADEIKDLERGIFIREVKSSSLTAEGLVFLDQLDTSGDYGRTKKAALTAAGLVLLDQVVTGTHGLVKETAISAGKIKLSTAGLDTSLGYGLVAETEISGGYIKLTTNQNLAAQGMEIVSSSSSTRIRINENRIAGYNAGVLQFELKASDGRAYAGAGAVILGDFGIRVTGEYLRFYYGTTSYGSITSESTGIAIQAPARTIRLSGADVAILANYIRPAFTLDSDLGLASKIWNSGFIRNLRPGAHEVGTVGYSNEAYNSVVAKYLYSDDGSVGSYQKHDDIALLKAIKFRKNKEGKDVLDASSLPPELYMENEQGQRYVNVAGLAGLNLGIQSALLARIEALEAK